MARICRAISICPAWSLYSLSAPAMKSSYDSTISLSITDAFTAHSNRRRAWGQVHQSDARHHGRAVRERQPVADAKPEGRYAACRHRFGSRDGFAPERDLRLADQRQCDMRQLHQVAACAHAAVARHERVNFVVEEIGQYPAPRRGVRPTWR